MVSSLAAFGFVNLCLAFAALELFFFLNSQCGAGTCSTTTSAEAPLLHSAAEAFLLLAAAGAFYVAVALTYRHQMGRHVAAGVPVAGAGNGRLSISGLVIFMLCVSAGTLEFIMLGAGHAAGGGGDEHARALVLAALRALPAAATGTFFLGMMLIIIAHVRAGGEGGGTGAIVAGDRLLRLRLLTSKVAAGMAAALVSLMVMALTLHGAKLHREENQISPYSLEYAACCKEEHCNPFAMLCFASACNLFIFPLKGWMIIEAWKWRCWLVLLQLRFIVGIYILRLTPAYLYTADFNLSTLSTTSP